MWILNNHRTRLLGIIPFLGLLLFSNDFVFARDKPGKAYLGVQIESLSHEDRKSLGIKHGVRVVKVMTESPAENAGILEEDIIQYFDSRKVRRAEDLVRFLKGKDPGDKVVIELLRDGDESELTIEIGKMKSGRDKFSHAPHFHFHFAETYLGIHLANLNEDLARYFKVKPNEGVLIIEVEADSPAEEAGLKAGDVIVNTDGTDVQEADEIRDLIRDLEEEDEVDITVIRNGRKMKLTAGLAVNCSDFHWNQFHHDFDSDYFVPHHYNLNNMTIPELPEHFIE